MPCWWTIITPIPKSEALEVPTTMPMNLSSRLALILVLGIALLPGQVRAGVFNPETFTLANGMQVVVVNNPRVPAVTQMVC